MSNQHTVPIVLLHGWGNTMSGQKYHEVKKLLEKAGYTVYTPDLPGFGNNPLEKNALVFEDYIQFVHDFVVGKIKNKKVIFIGHSFGGRIAIKFTVLYPELVEALILTGASGIPRPLNSLRKKIIYGITKVTRPLFAIPPFSWFYKVFRKVIYYAIGEMDYYKAGSLQETFKNVYKVSVVSDLDNITIPTLLVWGRDDTFTPLADGVFMHERIKKSQFVVLENENHKLPYENPAKFVKEIISFLP